LTINVREIRDRAERFRRALVEERLEVRAGRKAWPEFTSLYEAQTALQHTEAMPSIERELASATGEDERRLRRLLSWAAQHHVQRQTAPLDDEYAFWAATATTGTPTADLSLGAVTRAVETESNRSTRAALDGARTRLLEEAIPLQLDRVTRWRTATEELGYGDVLQATERLGGLNLDGLLIESRRLVEETREVYEKRLAEELTTRLGIEPGAAASHDLAWLRRMSWLDKDLEGISVLDNTRRDLEELGLPLEAGGRVEIRGGSFAEAGASPMCAPLAVPWSVVFLVAGATTMPAWQKVLKEIGKTLHYAYTDAGLPFEYRMIGDSAVIRAHGDLFEDLTRSGAWLERTWKSDWRRPSNSRWRCPRRAGRRRWANAGRSWSSRRRDSGSVAVCSWRGWGKPSAWRAPFAAACSRHSCRGSSRGDSGTIGSGTRAPVHSSRRGSRTVCGRTPASAPRSWAGIG
jgi:hypothetical protein